VKRKLSPDEAALWARVAGTVKPYSHRNPPQPGEVPVRRTEGGSAANARPAPSHNPPPSALRGGSLPPKGEDLPGRTLDANWDRKLARGVLQPDFTIDLHGAALDAAHSRLDHGLTLALAQGARVVLLVTGRPRPADGEAGRGERRGAIRAKFLDWLAAGSHSSRIAAIRPAHPRHGGAGAVYLILRRINSAYR
jgi:DNA-nicking Smr family endonuclease